MHVCLIVCVFRKLHKCNEEPVLNREAFVSKIKMINLSDAEKISILFEMKSTTAVNVCRRYALSYCNISAIARRTYETHVVVFVRKSFDDD